MNRINSPSHKSAQEDVFYVTNTLDYRTMSPKTKEGSIIRWFLDRLELLGCLVRQMGLSLLEELSQFKLLDRLLQVEVKTFFN
jgi:hypothetical protein